MTSPPNASVTKLMICVDSRFSALILYRAAGGIETDLLPVTLAIEAGGLNGARRRFAHRHQPQFDQRSRSERNSAIAAWMSAKTRHFPSARFSHNAPNSAIARRCQRRANRGATAVP